jgi:hypothetical protein
MAIPNYYDSLFTPEQLSDIRYQGISQGLLGLGQALSQAGAPSLMPQGSGLSQGLAAFNQGFQGNMDRALQDMLKGAQIKQTLEKQKQEQEFRQRLAQAYSTRPIGTGLTMTGDGSQQQMLLDQIQDFGQEGAQSTVGALQSNVNLPQERALDQRKFMSALAEFNPLEYAKLTMTGDKAPEPVRTFEAFSKMNPEQQKQFLAFRSAGTPQTNISLGEKGIDKITSGAVQGYFDRANSARQMATASTVVADLLERQGGGKAVQIGTDLSRALGLGDKETVAAADAAAALVTQTAVKVRPEGSGSTSNIEFEAYRQSIPSLANSQQGRRLMAQITESFAERNEVLADYAAQLYSQGRYSLKAMRDYDKSLGEILPKDFNAQVKSLTGKESPAPTRRRY